MATDESVTMEKMSSSEEDAVFRDPSTPLNFSELSLDQFGISAKSFTPLSSSSSKYKDKSRLAQIKARRRSSVGVRGSPETNSLIRFIAQQRMKTPPTSQTPGLVGSSPFFPRVASTLRQKMASFQNLMDVEESDACDPMPVQDSNIGGCIMTRDYLSDGISCSEGKENNPPTTPTPGKRRRLGPIEGCSVEIREADAFIPHSSLKEQEEAVCEHHSPGQPPSDDPASASPLQKSPLFHISSISSLHEIRPTGKEYAGTPMGKKRKQVRFGGPLSPEFFDKNMPSSTPLRKGGTPARAPTPGESLQLRSVLKTPQRSESDTPQYKPELDSPTGFGASPIFAIPRKYRVIEEDGSEYGKIVFPPMEEIDSALKSDTECVLDAQPLNLNMAFHEEALSQDLTDCEIKPGQTSQLDECESVPEEKQPEAADQSPASVRSSSRRKKTTQEPEAEPQARSSKRKRKLPEESEPVKRSTRSAAKSACRKMKVASASRLWSKEVNRSLYGPREYASKNPTLSPIRERLSFISQSPEALQTPESCTAENQETLINPQIANDTEAPEDLAVTETMENTVLDSSTSPSSSKGNCSRAPGSTNRRRGRKKKVVADCEQPQDRAEEKMEQHSEDQSSSSSEFSGGTPSKPSKSQQDNVDTEELSAEVSLDPPCTNTETSEHHTSLQTSTPYCPHSAEESSNTEQTRRGRRSSALQEPQNFTEEFQASCDVDEGGLKEQAGSQHSDGQEELRGANQNLASWQADFNSEDVFKPAARRGQSLVRRSLRNQSSVNHNTSAGLVWLPHTSPVSVKVTRRRSRGWLSGALLVQHPLPEENQDAPLNELRVEGDNNNSTSQYTESPVISADHFLINIPHSACNRSTSSAPLSSH